MTDIPKPVEKLQAQPVYHPDRHTHQSFTNAKGWGQMYQPDTTGGDEYPYVFIKEPGKEPVVYFKKRSFGKKDSAFTNQTPQGHEAIFEEHKIIHPFYPYSETQRQRLKQQGYQEVLPEHVEIGILKRIKNTLLENAPDKIIVLITRMRKVNTANCAERRKDKKMIKDRWKKIFLNPPVLSVKDNSR